MYELSGNKMFCLMVNAFSVNSKGPGYEHKPDELKQFVRLFLLICLVCSQQK